MSQLMPCKACKKEVKAGVKTCPHCGQSNPTLTIKMAVVSTIIIVLLIGFTIRSCQSTPEEKAAEAQSAIERTCKDSVTAQVMSQTYIKSALKSPSTADFPLLPNHAIYKGECLHLIESHVDSQNSFGAVIRSQTSVLIRFSKETKRWALEDISIK